MSLFWEAVKNAEKLKLPFKINKIINNDQDSIELIEKNFALEKITGVTIPLDLSFEVIDLLLKWDVDKSTFYPKEWSDYPQLDPRHIQRMVSQEFEDDEHQQKYNQMKNISKDDWKLIHDFHLFWDTLEDAITYNFPLLLKTNEEISNQLPITKETTIPNTISPRLKKIIHLLPVTFPAWPIHIPLID